jgi:hypothetical protein
MNMKNTIYTFAVFIFLLCIFSFLLPVVIAINPGEIQSGSVSLEYHNVSAYAPAVAQTLDCLLVLYFGV